MNYNFKFTEMETCVLEKAVKMILEYDRHCLKKEKLDEVCAFSKEPIYV